MKHLRKILIPVLAAVCALTAALAVGACAGDDGGEVPHTHTYTEWGISETEHWKKCPDDGAEEAGSRASHSFGSNGKCECGYEENHVHSYTEWGMSEDEHWKMCPVDSVEQSGTREAHRFSDFVTERAPDFDTDGVRVKSCSDCGKRVTETIPKYTEDSVFEYTLEFVRSNGQPFTGSVRLGITITDAAGNVPLDENGREVRGAYYTVSPTLRLKAGVSHGVFNVAVTIASSDKDHALLDTSLTVTPDAPTAKIRIKTNPPTTEPSSYREGSVLYNYTFTSVKGDGETRTLADLCEGNKVVLFSFFYVGCRYCQIEIPAILEAYPEYQSEMAIVFLDVRNAGVDSDSAIMEWAREYEIDDFFIARGTFFSKLVVGTQSGSVVQVDGVPVSLFVDSEGSILTIHSGAIGHGSSANFATNKADVYAVFDPVMAKVGWARPTATSASLEVIVPAKRKEL